MPKFEEGEFKELEEYWDRIVPRNFFALYANTDGHNNSNTRNGGWIISNGWEKHNYTPNSGWTRSNKDWEGNTIERNSDGGKWSNETENLQHESMTQEREQMDKRKNVIYRDINSGMKPFHKGTLSCVPNALNLYCHCGLGTNKINYHEEKRGHSCYK